MEPVCQTASGGRYNRHKHRQKDRQKKIYICINIKTGISDLSRESEPDDLFMFGISVYYKYKMNKTVIEAVLLKYYKYLKNSSQVYEVEQSCRRKT